MVAIVHPLGQNVIKLQPATFSFEDFLRKFFGGRCSLKSGSNVFAAQGFAGPQSFVIDEKCREYFTEGRAVLFHGRPGFDKERIAMSVGVTTSAHQYQGRNTDGRWKV